MTIMATRTRSSFPAHCEAAERNRAQIPMMHCDQCGMDKHWSNPSDNCCDACQQGNPIRIMGNSHGVDWHRNTEGIPN